MTLFRKQHLVSATAVLAAILLIGVILSPWYLVTVDPPQKSDIIIQFVGSDHDTRYREAVQLTREGYSDYLFIPTLFSLYRADQNRNGLTSIRFADIKPGIEPVSARTGNGMSIAYFKKIRNEYRFPGFYEDTHAEILLAKRAMDACGFRSAIFVSSPYHLRRIKIITGSIFGSSYDIRLVPSRFERRFEAPLTSQQDLKHCFTELPKIVWFICYDLWGHWSGTDHE